MKPIATMIFIVLIAILAAPSVASAQEDSSTMPPVILVVKDTSKGTSDGCPGWPMYLDNQSESDQIVLIKVTRPPFPVCRPRETVEREYTIPATSRIFLGYDLVRCGADVFSTSCASVSYSCADLIDFGVFAGCAPLGWNEESS